MRTEGKRTRGISLRVTSFVKRLLLAIVEREGFPSEASAVEAALREYAEKRRIRPLPETTDEPAEQAAAGEG